MTHIDEMTNEDLERLGHSEWALREELYRVQDVINRHALTGDDLSHWFDRSRILGRLLHEGKPRIGALSHKPTARR